MLTRREHRIGKIDASFDAKKPKNASNFMQNRGNDGIGCLYCPIFVQKGAVKYENGRKIVMSDTKWGFPWGIASVFVLVLIFLMYLRLSDGFEDVLPSSYDEPSIKVTLYDHSGGKIRSWDGKIKVSDTVNVVRFVTDDETVVINGGIVVIEEV